MNNTQTRLESYLIQFAKEADAFFSKHTWMNDFFNFYKNFYKEENLSNAEWSDFQKLGDHIHSFQSLAIAKGNALGKPNLAIEEYRKAFKYMSSGTDTVEVTINNLYKSHNGKYPLPFFGNSSISELVAYAFPDQYVVYNARDVEALEFLGITIPSEKGDKFGEKFLRYNQALDPIKASYIKIVGQCTNTTIPLELDQFFSWIYETQIVPIKAKSDIYLTLFRFIRQSKTNDLKQNPYPVKYKGLKFRVSFGKGIAAKVPWIAFLQEPNKISDGIYPVYLYFKEKDLLILSYGISETSTPNSYWKFKDEPFSISDWFKERYNEEPSGYGASYVFKTYDLSEELSPEIIQDDLNAIINLYTSIEFEPNVEEGEPEYHIKKYWLMAPGRNASKWVEFYKDGIIGIGPDDTGDLANYSNREDIRRFLIELYPEANTTQSNNSLALWEFYTVMKIGDIIIPKSGVREYLGYGIVESDYIFDEGRVEYKHIHKVNWVKNGSWAEEVHNIVQKTLTDITKYPDYVDRLKRQIGIEQEATISSKINYWWMNANAKYWRIDDFEIGQEQIYNTHNEKGNKRSRYEYFEKVIPGDLILGYQSSPTKKVVAVFEVTKAIYIDEDDGEEKICIKIQKFLPEPVSWNDIVEMPELEKAEIINNRQGTLFKLERDEFNAILNKDFQKEMEVEAYGIEKAMKALFLEQEEFQKIIDNLEYKKNIILQGPPGTGKTFMAKRIAYTLMELKDDTKIEMIQFHQSYSYEDFIQGYRPTLEGNFKLENGIFYRFCKKAQNDPENKYIFIIDEINRGNLSKIFGELMLLIEVDKRGKKYAVSLTYSPTSENRFYIPENVYIIGTMNTADRSLAVVDYALRRRFAFINIHPKFSEKFRAELIDKGVDESIIEKIRIRLNNLNEKISSDGNLGKGFQLGHSYFCNVPEGTGDEDWYLQIIEHEIEPLLSEYWFDREETARINIRNLKD